jgi:hypothetical protein
MCFMKTVRYAGARRSKGLLLMGAAFREVREPASPSPGGGLPQ